MQRNLFSRLPAAHMTLCSETLGNTMAMQYALCCTIRTILSVPTCLTARLIMITMCLCSYADALLSSNSRPPLRLLAPHLRDHAVTDAFKIQFFDRSRPKLVVFRH